MTVEFGELIPLRDAVKLLPNAPSDATAWRWVHHGVHGVKLRASKCGHRVCTTRAWLSDFVSELSRKAGMQTDDRPAPRSPSRRQREHARADAACEKAGW